MKVTGQILKVVLYSAKKSSIAISCLVACIINIGSAYAGCDNALTQNAMNECAWEDYERVEQSLKLLIEEHVKNQDNKKLLLSASEIYKKYTDQQCDFDTRGTKSGSIQNMILAQCKTTLLNNYLDHLKAQTKCIEGDMSCAPLNQ